MQLAAKVSKREKEFNLSDFFKLLVHRRAFILACVVIFAVFLTAAALATDPAYEAKGSLQIASQAGGLGAISEYLSVSGGTQLVSEIEIIRSRGIAQTVIDDLGLRVQVHDETYPNPLIKAIKFVFADRLTRGLRSLRITDVEFSPSSVDSNFYVTFTGESGGFNVTGPTGDLGSGKVNVPFTSENLSFTATRVIGKAGSKFRLTPKTYNATMKTWYERLEVAPLGTATRTNLIQVAYRGMEPTLVADVVNTVIAEYDRLDMAWKSSQGAAQTAPIETRLAEVIDELSEAETELENYKNQHGVVSLPDEARIAVSALATREAEKADLSLRISMLQDIHSTLAGQLDSDTFTVPPALTGDPVIQQLAADHARMTVELEDLLLDYTENHPNVVSKRNAILGVRGNILGTISSTMNSLTEQRNNLDSMIGELEQSLYTIPGVERNLVDLTRKLNVAEEVHLLLVRRLNEARIVTSSIVVGNRIIDTASPPAEPVSPSIKLNLLMGLGLGLVLGIVVAFLLELIDPRLRRPDQIAAYMKGNPIAVVYTDSDAEISRAASVLSLAALRSGNNSIALVCPSPDHPGIRYQLENIIRKVSIGLRPLILIDPMPGSVEKSFFEVDPSGGLSELGAGLNIKPKESSVSQVFVIPPGAEPSSSLVTNSRVRNALEGFLKDASLNLFWLQDFVNDPAMRGWTNLNGGAVLVLGLNYEYQAGILDAMESLETDGVPVLAVILIDV